MISHSKHETIELVKKIQLKNYIAGEWVPCQESSEPLVEPSWGTFLTHAPTTSPGAMERALEASAQCQRRGDWQRMGSQRAEFLREIAEHLETQKHTLATVESLNTGIILSQTEQLMTLLPHVFREAAHQLEKNPDLMIFGLPKSPATKVKVLHRAWGPALCLSPWNAPAMISAHKLASALAAGAPAILKPSEWTPYTAQLIFEAVAKAGLPKGAAQLIHGGKTEGAFLVCDPRIRAVSFTGGEDGGQKVAAACLPTLKRFQLELGGHNPFIVLPDASLEAVLDGVMAGLTTLNGQWCRAIGRIYLPRSWSDDFVRGFQKRVQELPLGASLEQTSTMGPLIHRSHKRHLLTQASELLHKGAQLVGTINHSEDCYLRPFLLAHVPRKENKKELFGPIATLDVYDASDELGDLFRVMGESPYGLAATLYGQDPTMLQETAERLQVGSTKINQVTLTSLLPDAPRCAWGQSGYGDEGNFATFRFFQGSSVIGPFHGIPEDRL